MKFLIIPLILAYLSIWITSVDFGLPELTPSDSLHEDTTEVVLLFSGDVMQHMPQINAAWDDSCKCYNYDTCFAEMSEIFKLADIAIINLETTLASTPYSGYPQFSAPDELIFGLKNAGIDVLAMANNHSCDKSRKGIERSLKMADSLEFLHTGTFYDSLDLSMRSPLYIEKNGFKIALLNYTYGTNGIAIPKPTIVNQIDSSAIRRDYHLAMLNGADMVIPFFHWGIEYQTAPNDEQKKTAEFCAKLGIKLIIGSHPHVIQPAQKYVFGNDTIIIAWSLGNFVSNQRQVNTDGGMSVMVKLQKESNKCTVASTGYFLHWVYIEVDQTGKKKYKILPVSAWSKKLELSDSNASTKMNLFAKNARDIITESDNHLNEIIFDSLTQNWVLP